MNNPLLQKKFKSHKSIVAVVAFTVLLLYKLSYGIYPFLDDYIQFKVYSLHINPVKSIFWGIGTCATRPLANLLDIVLYSKFYNNLFVPFFIITLMHFASIFLMTNSLKKIGIYTTYVFVVLSLLNPLLAESVYWLSASNRILVSFFFAQLAVWFLCSKYYKNNAVCCLCFWLIHLLSLLFYEQTAVFSFFWSMYFCKKKKMHSEMFICIINVIFITAYYLVFRNYGVFSNRGGTDLFNFAKIFQSLSLCLSAAIKCVFNDARNISFSVGGIIALLALSLLKVKQTDNVYQKVILGFVVTLISFAPFFVLKEFNINFRNLFLMCIGFALMCDALFSVLPVKKLLFIGMCALLIGCTHVEMEQYKSSYTADNKIIRNTVNLLSDNQKKSDAIKICVIGAKQRYTWQSVTYGEHISSVTSSDWAYTGALRAYTENAFLPLVTLNDRPDFDSFDVVLKINSPDNIVREK